MENIEKLLAEHRKLGIEKTINWEKHSCFSLVCHSTRIEGSTLTETETQLLLEKGLTAKGKPLEHHNMVKDHYDALMFALDRAKTGQEATPDFICRLSSMIMKTTGKVHNTMLGSFDSSKGELRKLNVTAGGRRFPDFTKVPALLEKLCSDVEMMRRRAETAEDRLNLSFDAHFNLVSVHPFADGNGRLSRLFMNFLQHSWDLPLSVVYDTDKGDYYKALEDTREKEDIGVFRDFMKGQYAKKLTEDIQAFHKAETKEFKPGPEDKDRGFGMSMFLF